jgi:phosphoglycolate phosphatase
MMSAIAGVLFDKDGVFVDFEKTWTPVLRAVAVDVAGGDKVLETELLDVAGFDPVADVFLPGSIWAAGHANDLVGVWLPMLAEFSQQSLLACVTDHCVRAPSHPLLPLEQQREIFKDLKRMGLRLGVATNDSTASAHATVGNFGLADMFDAVMGYDAVANPKPAGDPVTEFAVRTGIEPSQIMMVGDNTHDMECGRAGGAALCVGVLSGNSTRAELEPLADHLLDDISSLSALLRA